MNARCSGSVSCYFRPSASMKARIPSAVANFGEHLGAEVNHQCRIVDGLPPEFRRRESGASKKLLHSRIELGSEVP